MDLRCHLVYCRSRTVLDRRTDRPWLQLQEDYGDFMTSLGPMTAEEILEFFRADFGSDESVWPFARQEVLRFFSSEELVLSKQENPIHLPETSD